MSHIDGEQRHADEWNLREKLALVSCVRRVGRDSWSAVARMMRNIVEPGRPTHFFSAGRCALKFAELNTSGETKKRELKKNSKWNTDSDQAESAVARRSTSIGSVNYSVSASGMSDEQLLEERLQQQRIDEIRAQLAETHRRFKQRVEQLTDLQSGRLAADVLRQLQHEMLSAQRQSQSTLTNAARRSQASQTAEQRAETSASQSESTNVRAETKRAAESSNAEQTVERNQRSANETVAKPVDVASDTRRNEAPEATVTTDVKAPEAKPSSRAAVSLRSVASEPDAASSVADSAKPPAEIATPKRTADSAQKPEPVAAPSAARAVSPGAPQKAAQPPSSDSQASAGTAPLKLTLKLNRTADQQFTATSTTQSASGNSTPVAAHDSATPTRSSAEKAAATSRETAETSRASTRQAAKAGSKTPVETAPVPSPAPAPPPAPAPAPVPPGGDREDGWAVASHDPLCPALPAGGTAEREQRARFKKQALEAHRAVCTHKHTLIFQRPVTAEQAPGYASAVLAPADLTGLRRRIEQAAIGNYEQLAAALRRMFVNAVMFNRRDDRYFAMAVEMHDDAMARLELHFPLTVTDLPVHPNSSVHELAASLNASLLSPATVPAVSDSPVTSGALAGKSLRAASSKKPQAPVPLPPAAVATPILSTTPAPSDDPYASYSLLLRRRRSELLIAASAASSDQIPPREVAASSTPQTQLQDSSRRTRKRARSHSSSTTELDNSNGDKSEREPEKQASNAASASKGNVKQAQQQSSKANANDSRSNASSAAKKRRK